MPAILHPFEPGELNEDTLWHGYERIGSQLSLSPSHVDRYYRAADIVLFSRRGIRGCVTDFGGATSHVSIMALALGVPAVVSRHGTSESI